MENIYTIKFILKNFEDVDLDGLYEVLSDNAALKKGEAYDFQKALNFLNKALNNDQYIAIVSKLTKKIVGLIEMKEVKAGSYECEYLLNNKYANCGVASEALSDLYEAMAKKGLKEVVCKTNNPECKSFKLSEESGIFGGRTFAKVLCFMKD